MTAIFITGTTIVLFNIAGIAFAVFMLTKRSEMSTLKKAPSPINSGMNGDPGIGTQSASASATGFVAGAAAASAFDSDLDDDDDFDDIDDILDKLDLNDFDDDLDFKDF